MKLLLGTKSADKVKEIREILGDSFQWLDPTQHPFSAVTEDGDTLEENARKKAQSISKETNSIVLAEDTGLEVDELKGAPGVFSARFAGPDADSQKNVTKLLDQLKGKSNRRARFHCVCVVHFPDGKELVTTGVLEGSILTAPRGRGGFGYDPVFLPDGFPKTLAELPSAMKNKISHRAIALRAMKAKLEHLQASS
ncbi:MAG TPA: RdgB/HAM1 family non-canonical purine NTP pyrophosphatase [Candidatus Bipolaricaulota bacterium]